MPIMLNSETEARLREKAVREGQDINILANTLLNMALEWEVRDHAEAVEGIRRGLEHSHRGAAALSASLPPRSAQNSICLLAMIQRNEP